MTAINTVGIGYPDPTIAIPARSGDLVSALWAKVKLSVDTGAAGGAQTNHRLPEQEVEHRADTAWHSQANDHPCPRAHVAARCIAAHISDHKHIQGR